MSLNFVGLWTIWITFNDLLTKYNGFSDSPKQSPVSTYSASELVSPAVRCVVPLPLSDLVGEILLVEPALERPPGLPCERGLPHRVESGRKAVKRDCFPNAIMLRLP